MLFSLKCWEWWVRRRKEPTWLFGDEQYREGIAFVANLADSACWMMPSWNRMSVVLWKPELFFFSIENETFRENVLFSICCCILLQLFSEGACRGSPAGIESKLWLSRACSFWISCLECTLDSRNTCCIWSHQETKGWHCKIILYIYFFPLSLFCL